MAGELDKILGDIVGGGSVNPSLINALLSGVGRTDISPLLSNVGLGAVTGGVDVVALEQAMKEEVARQERQYLAERAQRESEIIAPTGQAPVLDAYVVDLLPTLAGLASQFEDPQWESGLERAFQAVAEGQVSAQQAGEQLYKNYSQYFSPTPPTGVPAGAVAGGGAELASAVDTLLKGAEKGRATFKKDENDYAQRKFKETTLLSGLGELAPFDVEGARRRFYDDAGVSALGYMSDPSATYQLDPTVVAKSGSKQDIGEFRSSMEKLLTPEQKVSPYSFGAEQQSAASRARQLQQERIKRVIAKEEVKRKENADKLSRAIAMIGYSPYKTELDTMLNFAVGEASV